MVGIPFFDRAGDFGWSPGLVPLAAATLVTLAALGLGRLAGWRGGPALARWWAAKAGERSHRLGDHSGTLVRYFIPSLILLIALRLHSWSTAASIILGLAAATCVAVLVGTFTRVLRFPRWLSGVLATGAFAGVLSEAVNGLQSLASLLESIAFRIGTRSFTLLGLAQTAVALLVLAAVVRIARRVIAHSIAKTHRLDGAQKVLAQKLAGVALVAAAFFIGIDLLGIDLTALAVFSGAVGLAIGFGLQKTFGNLIAGIILLLDRSIKPGDVISVGDSFGAISKIGVRAVSIVTRDGKEHLIPNENLMTQEVVNWSYSNTDVRVHIPVGVAYNSDLALAQRLMIEAAKTPPRVLNSPPPVVWLKAFGDSAVEHEILVWISDPESGVGNVQSEVLNAVWKLFQERGIEIPFPQSDVHIRSLPEPGSAAATSKPEPVEPS